jgi:hypothetical protein
MVRIVSHHAEVGVVTHCHSNRQPHQRLLLGCLLACAALGACRDADEVRPTAQPGADERGSAIATNVATSTTTAGMASGEPMPNNAPSEMRPGMPPAAPAAGTGASAPPSPPGGPGPGTAGTGVSPDPGVAPSAPPQPSLPAVDSVDVDGPFATTQDLGGGPQGSSGVFHPSELGKDGLKHPILLWGCGGTTQPATYALHMNRVASHGIVAIAEVSEIGNNGEILLQSLDWILAENERPDSIFFEKLDTTRIAAGGHSIGSANTFFIADDPRLTTTIHVAGGSLDDVNDPFAPTTGMGGARLTHPVAYICSESDTFGNVEKTEMDYARTTVPAFFTIMGGTEHNGAATEALSPIVAWLRWQLGGDEDRRAMFLDPMGEFSSGRYVSRTKNW